MAAALKHNLPNWQKSFVIALAAIAAATRISRKLLSVTAPRPDRLSEREHDGEFEWAGHRGLAAATAWPLHES
jgi:hypothetical protein